MTPTDAISDKPLERMSQSSEQTPLLSPQKEPPQSLSSHSSSSSLSSSAHDAHPILVPIAIALSSLIACANSATSSTFISIAFESFEAYDSYATAQCVLASVLAVSKLLSATSAGRAKSYVLCLACFVIGNTICAWSNSAAQLTAGLAVSVIASSLLQLNNQVLLGQMTTPRVRGVCQALLNASLIVLFPLNGWLTSALPWRVSHMIFALAYIPVGIPLLFIRLHASEIPSVGGALSSFIPVLRNTTVVAASAINFFDFVSFYLTFTHLFGFISATQNWSVQRMTYFINCQSVSLTLFAILWAAFAVRFSILSYKLSLQMALVVRTVGISIMMYALYQGNTVVLVFAQIMQGAAGGIAAITSGVLAQTAASPSQLAFSTAAVLVFAELGGVVGNLVSGIIWQHILPLTLKTHCAEVGVHEKIWRNLIGNPSMAQELFPDLASSERLAINAAFIQAMGSMVAPAIMLSIIPVVCAVFVQDLRPESTSKLASHLVHAHSNASMGQPTETEIISMSQSFHGSRKRSSTIENGFSEQSIA